MDKTIVHIHQENEMANAIVPANVPDEASEGWYLPAFASFVKKKEFNYTIRSIIIYVIFLVIIYIEIFLSDSFQRNSGSNKQ